MTQHGPEPGPERDRGLLYGEPDLRTDRHLCGVFPMETRLRLLRDLGFEVKQTRFEHSTFTEDDYYPLLVCTKAG